MQIRVRSLQGDEFIVQVQQDQLVAQLKASISEKPNGPPVERQKLIYKGRTMQDSMLLAEYHLEEDCKVHLIIQKEASSSPSTQPTSGAQETSTSSESTAATPTQLPPAANSGRHRANSPCPMDISTASSAAAAAAAANHNQEVQSARNINSNTNIKQLNRPAPSRFESILRERLAHHFPTDSVDKILDNLYQEIDADLKASSLDDLERLAKQKLNITNE